MNILKAKWKQLRPPGGSCGFAIDIDLTFLVKFIDRLLG